MPVQISSLRELIGLDYDDFWNDKHLYRLCMGSKGSKKSKTTALNHIYRLMEYPLANLLVVRKVYGTIKNSCYTDLLWAIDRLGVTDEWETHASPLQITHRKTGQTILFRGMDKAEKLASLSVRHGYLCWVWIEEFYEISNQDEFLKLDFGIRGELPPESGLFMQITCTFNPWAECWIKDRFFDKDKLTNEESDKIFTKVTTYRNNEFLSWEDIEKYEDLSRRNPRAARVICDGNWGISAGQVYTNWEIADFDLADLQRAYPDLKLTRGVDFGFTISYTAFVAAAVDLRSKQIWIYDEIYGLGMTNTDLAMAIYEKGYENETIWADQARPDTIHALRTSTIGRVRLPDGSYESKDYNLPGIRGSLKGADSVEYGIDLIQGFRIWVLPTCLNMIKELNLYSYEQDSDGNFTSKVLKENDHLCDALRYSLDHYLSYGKGAVVEAKGEDSRILGRAAQHRADSTVKGPRKTRRVYSTSPRRPGHI